MICFAILFLVKMRRYHITYERGEKFWFKRLFFSRTMLPAIGIKYYNNSLPYEYQ
jgi:hypothetical protein